MLAFISLPQLPRDLMKVQDLPHQVQKKLEELVAAVQRALEANRLTQHTFIACPSSMPPNSEPPGVLNAAKITTLERPPLDYDEKEVQRAHRAVYEAAGEGVLYGLVVRARRQHESTGWHVETHVISAEEYVALQEARKLIDDAIQGELLRMADVPDFRWASFGRINRGRPIEVNVKHNGLDKFPPSPALLELMAKAEALYRSAGMEPVILRWTFTGKQVTIAEYFE